MAKRLVLWLILLHTIHALDPWLLFGKHHSPRRLHDWRETKQENDAEVNYQDEPYGSKHFQLPDQSRIIKAPSKRSPFKPSSCTCTCETKVLKEGDESHYPDRNTRQHAYDNIPSSDYHVLDPEPQASKYGGHYGPAACYRRDCRSDKDCCQQYDICDHSSKTCRDCWTKEVCETDDDCCNKYPHCKKDKNGDSGTCAAS